MIDIYGSHLPALVTAFSHTVGPVIEFGAGKYSTPVLASLCIAEGRKFVSVDHGDIDFVPRFCCPYVQRVCDWKLHRWGLAFVDLAWNGAQPNDRGLLVEALQPHADVIVFHDAENHSYGYAEAVKKFKFHHEYRMLLAPAAYYSVTGLVSDVEIVQNWFC